MSSLADLPSGTIIFIDANCLVYHFFNTYPSCTHMLQRAERGDINVLTSVSVVAELRHRLMMLEGAQQFHLPIGTIREHLRRHPERIRLLTKCHEAIESLPALRIEILPISWELLLASQRISAEEGLLTNDALLIAVMRERRLTHLASNDADFARLRDITLWRP